MATPRRTGSGTEASERLGRVRLSTRNQRLIEVSRQRSIGRKAEETASKPSKPSRSVSQVKALAQEVVSSTKPESERVDPANKVEAAAEFKARGWAADRLKGKVPGAGVVVRTVSSRSGVSENVEAIGQRLGKDVARKSVLRTARVGGRAARRTAAATGKGTKVLTRSAGTTATRGAQAAARAAAQTMRAAATFIRTTVSAVGAAVTSGPVLIAVVAVVAIVAVVASVFASILPTISNASSCTPAAANASIGASYGGFSGPDQTGNAQQIIRSGKDHHLDTRDITIGVMTAIGESSLRVLAFGDAVGPDSRGLFQQRDSWGPLAVRMDAYGSAGLFFDQLVKIPNRDAQSPTLVAHEVQHNADPNHYAKFWQDAVTVVSKLGGGVAASAGSCSGGVAGQLGKNDDYPYKSEAFNAPNAITGFAARNCTDFAWWRMMQQLGITDPAQMDGRRLGPGNGKAWGEAWKRAGWTVTMTPKVGAIIWYATGEFGHVAVVKEIKPDGRVIEEGYNELPDHEGSYYTREIDPKSPSGYLLIPTKEQYLKVA